MTISATSQGLRPGVCLSTSRPSTPFDGQVIYETDTDKALVWNGSSWVYLSTGNTNNVGLELIKTDTITSGNSKEITGCFSSTYKNYQIILSNVRLSGTAQVLMRMGTLSTGTIYRYAGQYVLYTSSGVVSEQSNGANQWQIGLVTSNTTNSSAIVELQSPQEALTTGFQSLGNDPRSGGAGARMFTGYLDNTTQYTSFSLVGDTSTTFTSCDIAVYGYRNS
jgi:hypothetical protein